MKISTGLIGVFLAVGALALSSAHSKTAAAHSGVRPQLQPTASVGPDALASSSTLVSLPVAEVATASELAATASASAPVAPELAPAFGSLPPTPQPPRALRRIAARELTPAMMQAAAQIVRTYYAKPVGTNVDIQVQGTHFVARLERHYHPEGGPIKPWGFHPGVSLFAIR